MQISTSFLVIIVARITATNDNIPNKNERTQDNRPRIVGGSTTTIDEIPFQVSLRTRSVERVLTGEGHFCGGSLITRRVVLTAAHCCFKPYPVKRPVNDYLLVMGSTYLNRSSSTEKKYLLVDLKIHQLYSSKAFANDIALMLIDGVVPSSSLVRPIKLNQHPVRAGTMCQVSGWGRTDIKKEDISNELRRGQVPICDTNHCVKKLYPFFKQRSEICAGYKEGNINSCKGDSGGPLECGGVLVGVVSYGDPMEPEIPGAYQSVFYYRNWIKKQKNKFDSKLHTKSIASKSLASFCRCCYYLAFVAAFLYVVS